MEPAIREQFNPAILDQAVARYGLEPGSAEALDGFESFIFKVQQQGAPRILRLSHSLRRTDQHIAGEADFINYLGRNGLRVPCVVPSLSGRLTETIAATNGCFIAALFEFAPGAPIHKDDWQPPFFEKMGHYLGALHRLSKAYAPAQRSRFSIFDDSPPMLDNFIPVGDAIIHRRAGDLIATLRKLPADESCFGLIHVDFHRGNFFVDGGEIILFDFDDCQYSWYAHDIAMALFYAIPHDCSKPEDIAFGHTFLRRFLAGYRAETAIDDAWMARIPLFLKLRELELYAAIHRSMDLNNLDPWCASFMAGRRRKLEADVPYFDLDMRQL